jgi:hypothetical protein
VPRTRSLTNGLQEGKIKNKKKQLLRNKSKKMKKKKEKIARESSKVREVAYTL